ncbi:MAG: 3-dehydroquinate synthase [Armatimonadetes bacterium]|nr:3-dehydroquinate synthase [Armatimonadota bacterium]
MSESVVRIALPPAAAPGYDVRFIAADQLLEGFQRSDALITDTNLARHYPEITDSFDRKVIIPAGEKSKSGEMFLHVVESLAAQGQMRKGRIIAFGGGVVGDLAGYVAASFHRGVPFLQIPTSLLAMVDSSVGGKVGIDLSAGKNLAGAFWHPTEVRVCPDLLATLPEREFTNGMAEILKYGWIADVDLTDELIRERISLQHPRLQGVIRRCIEIKRDVVEEDPEERTGRRAILNFGHTVGHALEQILQYEHLLHGEAIAIGMVAEAQIGAVLGLPDFTGQIKQTFDLYGLPTCPDFPVDLDQILSVMKRDKKATGDGLATSLLTGAGECKLYTNVPEPLVRDVLKSLWHL